MRGHQRLRALRVPEHAADVRATAAGRVLRPAPPAARAADSGAAECRRAAGVEHAGLQPGAGNLFFLIAWVRFMQHLSSLGILGIKDALSAGPDFLGAVGILLATTHDRLSLPGKTPSRAMAHPIASTD